jgi:hypothetical protein
VAGACFQRLKIDSLWGECDWQVILFVLCSVLKAVKVFEKYLKIRNILHKYPNYYLLQNQNI